MAPQPSLTMVRSPLQVACECGNLPIGRLLLAKGASIEHTDHLGWTALTMLWWRTDLSFSRSNYAKALLSDSLFALGFAKQELMEP